MTKAKEIMTKEVKYIEPNTKVKEAARLMNEMDIGFLPVGENDRIIGIVTDRDITIRSVAKGHNPEQVTVREIMTPKCLYCLAEAEIEEVAENMGKNQIRRLPVLNEEKRLVGIVSLGDLVCKGSKEHAGHALHAISQRAH